MSNNIKASKNASNVIKAMGKTTIEDLADACVLLLIFCYDQGFPALMKDGQKIPFKYFSECLRDTLEDSHEGIQFKFDPKKMWEPKGKKT